MFCRHVFGNISRGFRGISRFGGNFAGFRGYTWISHVPRPREISEALVIFVVPFVFEIGQIIYGTSLSLGDYRLRAQESKVKVVSFKISVIIQIIIEGYFYIVICFWNRPNYGASLSLRAYRRHALDSEVKVVSLLKWRLFIQIIIGGYFCSVICFWNRPNYGASLSLRAYRRRAQDSEVMVVCLLKCRSFIQIIIVGYFCSVICFLNWPNYGASLSLRAHRRHT